MHAPPLAAAAAAPGVLGSDLQVADAGAGAEEGFEAEGLGDDEGADAAREGEGGYFVVDGCGGKLDWVGAGEGEGGGEGRKVEGAGWVDEEVGGGEEAEGVDFEAEFEGEEGEVTEAGGRGGGWREAGLGGGHGGWWGERKCAVWGAK